MRSWYGELLKGLALGVCCFWIVGVGGVEAKSVKWDSQADWSKGKAKNVTWTKKPGQLEIVFDPNSVVETPFIYIPNSSLNTITKMDTTNGLILWTFNLAALKLGGSPSRTTVDSKGNVWVGLRSGNHVVAISAAGKFLTAVNIGKGPRAVTIDKQGNIWAGGYYAQSIVKISKTTLKAVLTVRSSQLCTYGATTDSDGNIWTMNRCKGHVAKISPAGQILKYVSAYGGYGLAGDRVGNVWVASYEGKVVYRINARTFAIKRYPLGAKGRGVGIDAKNRAWVACSHSSGGSVTRHLVRVDPKTGRVDQYKNVGLHTIGVAIDSKGYVWANSYSEGRAYKLRVSDGTMVASYPICDVTGIRPCANTGCKACSSPARSGPYTYSDMTGFSIQTRPAKGTYQISHNAKCKASFSKISWSGSTPSGTSVKVRARTASTQAGLASASWGAYVRSGQNPNVAPNRWIQLEFLMETNDARYTSIVTDATLNYDYFPEICDGVDNNCDGFVDENYKDLGSVCSVGVGLCANSGKKICNRSKNGTVCSAKPGSPKTEICDGLDNNCNGKIDENFTDLGAKCTVGKGICAASGVRVCDKSNRSKTTCSAKPGKPQTEICDGLDNNCDGIVDDTWPNIGKACEVGVGSCKNQGKWVCKSDKSGVICSVPPKAPRPEVCDGKDNDCNAKIDDGLIKSCSTKCGTGTQSCRAGQWVACTAVKPRQETCNGTDDDCNGQVDDGLERVCSTACGKGKETCVRGKWVFCSAKSPVGEVCDGQDNDCDGKTDEDLKPRRCLGDCGEGTATCKGGKWSGCSGPRPETEICDGKDNDCNGAIDDKLAKRCRTSCGEGRQVCNLGRWSLCNAPQPGKEICDSKDNDCDGKIDNGKGLCPASMLCQNGSCQQVCRNGECPKGFRCLNNICTSTSDPCKSVTCKNGTICVSGRCIDPCFTVSCPKKQVCEKGKCVEDNCYRKGCPKNQRCVDGKCESDPCDGVSCKGNQFCRNGTCVGSCAGVKCASDESCVDGKCEKKPQDPCSGVSCKQGERCEKGKCLADPCDGIQCPKGRQCINGQCRHDPCFNITCPKGQTCVKDQCVGEPANPGGENSGGESPGGENPGGENPSTSADASVQDSSGGTPTGDSDPKGGEKPSLADKKGGKPNTTPDSGARRYEPGNCGCHHEGGPVTLLYWFGLLCFLVYLRRLGRNRLR